MSYLNTAILTIIFKMLDKESQMSIETCCFCNVIVFNFPTRNLAKAKGNIDERCFSDKEMLVDWSALRLALSCQLHVLG